MTATTAANGTFTLAVPAGSYMLVVAPATANTYATLHKGITAATAAVGTVKLTALSADQQGWIGDVNAVRAAAAVPTSYSNLTVDEYATEQAQAYQTAGLVGPGILTDAGWTPYFNAWTAAATLTGYSPAGVLSTVYNPAPAQFTFGSVASGQYQNPVGAPGYVLSDAAWLWGDKSNCTTPFAWNNTSNCPFASTGHYDILSNTNDTWVGLGESGPDTYDLPTPNQWNYGIMVIDI